MLGQMIRLLLEDRGIPTLDRMTLGATPVVRRALLEGEIDLYVEYTGNAGFFFNRPNDPAWKDLQQGYALGSKLDLEANRIVWLAPARASNAWALAVRRDVATKHRLVTMTDFARWVREGGAVKLACSAEFANGGTLRSLESTYSFHLEPRQKIVLAGGETAATIGAAAARTNGINTAMVYGTDGGIVAADLVLLEDDGKDQPIYAPVPIVRETVLRTYPQIAGIVRPLMASFTRESLQALNARVQIDGESSEDVAVDYLRDEGLHRRRPASHERDPRRDPARRSPRCLAGLVAMLALALLPLIVFKENRIVPGVPRALHDLMPAAAFALYFTLSVAAAVAVFVQNPRIRLLVALIGMAVLAVSIAAAANALTPDGNRVVRVAPGAGFWIVLIALGLLATDALTRMRPGPWLRVATLGGFLAATLAALGTGYFDHLSIMREYAVNATRFAHEAQRHLLLALGSLAAAVIVALPLGVLCHRQPRTAGAVLGALNVVQTIPSIALFGILMAPLAALAVAFPLLAAMGVSGIGAAPAAIALFLYSLLPIVANTVVGLGRVSPAAVDAARGMGLTDGQVLRQVELPLALPTILTGIRIVLVQNIGMVTIAALIGGGGFGAFVFQGIGQTAIDLVLLGAIPTVVLAFSASVVLDALTDLTRRVPR